MKPSARKNYALFATVLGILAIISGTLVLVGWQLDSYTLQTFGLGGVTMKANTALSFLLSGMALVLLQRGDRRINVVLARIFSGVVALLGLLVLSQYVFAVNFGIDEFFFRDAPNAINTSSPGRMAPNTSLNFVLLGIALFAFSYRKMQKSFLVLILFVTAFSVSMTGLFGHISGLEELAGLAEFTKMAVNTSSVFIILCAGIYFTLYNDKIRTTLEYKLLAGLTVASVLIIFVSIISISSIKSLVTASGRVEHTQNVKQELVRVSSQVYELVSGDRAYIITGNDKYLGQWAESKENIPGIMDKLRVLTSDNPKQQKALITLNQLLKDRIDFSDLLIDTYKTKGRDAAFHVFESLKVKQVKETIGEILLQMSDEENRLLSERYAKEDDNANNTLLVIILNLSVQLVLLAFIFVFVKKDITGRRRAEIELQKLNKELEERVIERTSKLAESENQYKYLSNQFEAILDHIPGLVFYKDKNNNFILVNKYVADAHKITKEEMKNKSCHELYPEKDAQLYFEDDLKVIESGVAKLNIEEQWQTEEGLTWVSTSKIPFMDKNGNCIGIIGVSFDISERKKAEEETRKANRIYAVLSNINQAIVRVKDKQTLFDDACRIAVEDGKFRMAWIGMIDTQTNKVNPVAFFGFSEDYVQNVNVSLNDEKLSKSPIVQVLNSGVHYLANNIANNPDMIPWRENALKLGYKSSAAFPITVFGKSIGVFLLYSNEISFFDEAEVKLLDELAMDISFAVEFLENETSRKQAEEVLIYERNLLKSLMDNTNDEIYFKDRESRFVKISKAMANAFGLSDPEQAVGKTDFDFYTDELSIPAFQAEMEIIKTGQPLVGLVEKQTWPDGRETWVSTTKMPFRDINGEIVGTYGISRDITERKLAEVAVTNSETRYRRLFETAKDGILILDAETGKIVDVNPFMVEMLGYSREAFIEKTIWEIGFFLDVAMNQDKFLELQQKEYVRYEDLPLETIDGRLINIEFISNVYLVNNQKVVQCNIRNITDRKAAEKLIITQRNLGLKINSITKLDELFTVSIDALHNVTGMECGGFYLFDKEMQGLDLVYSKGLSDKFFSVTSHFDAGSDNVKLVKAGKPVFTDFDELPVPNNDIIRDEKLASVFVLPLMYKKSVFGSINLASHKKITLSIHLQKGVEAIATLISNAYGRIQNEEEIRSMNAELEIKVETRTEQLTVAKAEAERANHAKSEFLSRMSHELRTPMNSILGFAQLMNMGELAPAHKRGVNHILKAGKHLLELINEVLDLSRIEAGRLSVSLEPVQLHGIVLETLDIIRPFAVEKNITLEFPASPINDFFVKADRQKLKQVLLNLVNNAVKFNRDDNSVKVECSSPQLAVGSRQSESGSPRLAVGSQQWAVGSPQWAVGSQTEDRELKTEDRGLKTEDRELKTEDRELKTEDRELKTEDNQQYIRISVIDTGKGIAQEEMPKLFNPFQRIGTEVSEIEGTGLGLAVAKKLVEAMGGTIGVESEPGVGSIFWIELPQAEGQVEYNKQNGGLANFGTKQEQKKGTILYIEDNTSNIDLVEQILKTYHPEISLLTEKYGREAVKDASDYKPDLILLDLDLPDIHGSKVLKLLQSNPKTKTIPVVVISADAMEKQIEKLMKAGAKDYLTKPLDVVEFLKVVDEIMA